MAIDRFREGYLPLHERKMMHQYTHLWSSANESNEDGSTSFSNDETVERLDCKTPRRWFPASELRNKMEGYKWPRQWLLAWRNITNSTNERNIVASIIPLLPTDFTLRVAAKLSQPELSYLLLANFNSLVLDSLIRQRLGGNNLSDYILFQSPVLPPSAYCKEAKEAIRQSVIQLARLNGVPSEWIDEVQSPDADSDSIQLQSKEMVLAELDAFYARLYGLTRDELRYILDPSDVMGPDYPSETFRVLKTNEIRQFGEYRTQRLVLEAWDRLFGA